MTLIRIPEIRKPVKRRKDKPSVLKGKITRTRQALRPGSTSGAVMERSINMERDRACLFALAMQARPDITRAEMVRDHSVTGAARWYVRFVRKAVPTSLLPSLRTMQDVRAQRACDQGGEMEFIPMPERAGWYWTIHQYPDEDGRVGVYETHPSGGCTCPDYVFRCAQLGLKDKHQIALLATAVCVEGVKRDESKEARRARLLADRNRDFGLC